ncbi:MAG TPA: response regulator, partial [Planctomycetota bacterium]|nr:response regulator [Planctomycetota bacterium]
MSAAPRVLVVDDEPTVLDVFREYLAGEGYDITAVGSGEEAVSVLGKVKPDVILTDLNLPGLSGLDVMRQARTADPEVAVIVVTGHASASSAIDALRQGAYDYVTKPPDLYDVGQIVQRAIASRRLREDNRRLLAELRMKNEILSRHEQELVERVKLATWQMQRLYDVGNEIGANLDLVTRLGVITGKAAEMTGAAAAAVFLRQEESEPFHLASTHNLEGEGRPPLPSSLPAATVVLTSTGEPAICRWKPG